MINIQEIIQFLAKIDIGACLATMMINIQEIIQFLAKIDIGACLAKEKYIRKYWLTSI